MYFQWSEAFEIGVRRIDRQHEKLAGLVNAFHEAYVGGGSRELVFPLLNRLVRYVEEHFACEESLMEATWYPELTKQKRAHEALTLKIFALADRYEHGDDAITDETMNFLRSWLFDHILQVDRKMGEYVQARGVPPDWSTDGP